MELIKALGISWPTVISQLLNFGILYWLLKKFALDNLLTAIQKRQQEIATGLDNAKKADAALASAKKQEEEILAQARQEASAIVAAARQSGQQQEQQILEQAKLTADRVIADGTKQVEVQKGKMLLAVKSELATIIASGVESLVGERIDPGQVTAQYLQTGMEGQGGQS